ncbi:MAG: SpoIID/LytB domain-containing protein [Oscillospiraceae bacterium]|nr:SpoIID/LytB domain-containing protein [Oscillospiraceae bacterium]
MKKFLIFTVLLLALSLCAIAAPPEANPTVRVGLYYGNNAMISANLQNVEGYGYRFGFFDSAHNFIAQHRDTSTNRISMLKDANIYFNDGTFYETGAPSGSTLIGAFHIQLDTEYASSEEVSAMVTSLQLQGIPAFVSIHNGIYRIRVGSYSNLMSAQADTTKYMHLGSASAVGNNSKCVTVVNTVNGKILFEYDTGEYLAVYPSTGEVEIPLTWFKGYKYYGGFQYLRDGGNISVINFVPMQEYTKGVVPYEMSAKWPLETLKAQAMCARTYALYNYGKHGKSFDVCGSTDCQVYRGANSATENSDRAVDETYGMYILHDGKPINAVFCSSNGGATEDSENVWSATLPYLRGVYDNFEDLDTSTNGRWSYEYTSDQLTYILNAKGYTCNTIVNMYVKEFTRMGNVKTLTLVDSTGKEFNFSKEKARTILYSSTYKKYTHSQRYTVKKKGEISPSVMYVNSGSMVDFSYDSIFAIGKNGTVQLPNSAVSVITSSGITTFDPNRKQTQTSQKPSELTFVVSGTGWGHNVGLSQNGAKAMANAGYSAEDIIHFYYTDVDIFKSGF